MNLKGIDLVTNKKLKCNIKECIFNFTCFLIQQVRNLGRPWPRCQEMVSISAALMKVDSRDSQITISMTFLHAQWTCRRVVGSVIAHSVKNLRFADSRSNTILIPLSFCPRLSGWWTTLQRGWNGAGHRFKGYLWQLLLCHGRCKLRSTCLRSTSSGLQSNCSRRTMLPFHLQLQWVIPNKKVQFVL